MSYSHTFTWITNITCPSHCFPIEKAGSQDFPHMAICYECIKIQSVSVFFEVVSLDKEPPPQKKTLSAGHLGVGGGGTTSHSSQTKKNVLYFLFYGNFIWMKNSKNKTYSNEK